MIIDLLGTRDEKEVLFKFGESLDLGGPNGNYSPDVSKPNSGWGMNWNALNDSLSCLDSGGIWGTSKKFEFPLKLVIKNSLDFQKYNSESFKILQEILSDKTDQYKLRNKEFSFEFIS